MPTIVAPAELDRANSRISAVDVVTNTFAGGLLGAASFALVPWLPFLLDALSLLGRTAVASRLITRTSFVAAALVAVTVDAATSVRWSFVIGGSLHLIGAVLLWRSFGHEPTEPPSLASL